MLFADIWGFTRLSATLPPEEVVQILDQTFRRFDEVPEEKGLEKIKTIGDCYMVAAGLPSERGSPPAELADAALAMMAALREIAGAKNRTLKIRIGIHCGPVVAGVTGQSKFIYDLWGDRVNVASRMESTAPPGEIQVSHAMYERLTPQYALTFRGEQELRGKGRHPTYLLRGRVPDHPAEVRVLEAPMKGDALRPEDT